MIPSYTLGLSHFFEVVLIGTQKNSKLERVLPEFWVSPIVETLYYTLHIFLNIYLVLESFLYYGLFKSISIKYLHPAMDQQGRCRTGLN